MLRRRRAMLKNLGLTIATVVAFFGIIEIALRVTGIDTGRPHSPPIYARSDDPELSYVLRPNLREEAFRSTIVTDRRGLRSPEVIAAKQTIAVLGDSVAFGYGLENEQMLGTRLHALLGGTYNVVTGAAPGYTLKQEAALYRNALSVLHPGTLILVFYWNDLVDTRPAILDDDGNLQAPDWVPGSPTCHPIEEGVLGYLPGRCWFDLHSAFYRTVKKIIVARTERRNLEEQKTTFRRDAFGDDITDDQLKTYRQTLSAFARTLPRGMAKLFIIWPEKRLHLEATQELRDIAEDAGFRVLNLYEVFGNRPESLSWDTVHPSAKTVEEAAAVINAALEEWELLPQ